MKKYLLLIIIVLLILVGSSLYYILFRDIVEVKLKGESTVRIEYGKEYTEEGIILTNRDVVVESNKYKIDKDTNLDIKKIGDYIIKYKITYKNKEYELKRNVNVYDDIAPTLTVNLDKIEMDYCTKKSKKELTYEASDNYDGDISSKIERINKEDKIILKVSDSSGNKDEKEISIIYEGKPKDKFSLNGKNVTYVKVNDAYNEEGAKYTDGCGNKINKEVTIEGSVDTTIPGRYQVTYKVDDKSLARSVVVYDPAVENPFSNNRVVYLTFDDGPGYYTKKILNILDKYNVKATFFVTNQFPSYIHLIKDEYDKGHKIAVHTYTHKWDVYTSVEDYMNDFNKMNEVIKSYTGSYTKMFRFPGGSSNTVSKSYNKGIMSELANKMTEDGYVYFDWNVSSGDASSNGSAKIYSNVVSGVKNCSKCVVLMHDIKSTTANALDDILSTLTASGYQFDTLSESGPYAHHRINN